MFTLTSKHSSCQTASVPEPSRILVIRSRGTMIRPPVVETPSWEDLVRRLCHSCSMVTRGQLTMQRESISRSAPVSPSSCLNVTIMIVQGIRDNLELLPEMFDTSWSMRLYHNLTNPGHLSSLCQLACQYPALDLCHVSHLPSSPVHQPSNIFGMIWRFFPSVDPQVAKSKTFD